jgi:hypothetical protein
MLEITAMLFSIIVPIYNREACIHLAIESVIAQTYPSWELLLVDDGSTDQTEEICRRYAAEDTRIRYLRKENGGVSSARNLGLAKMSGEYLLFLDSDDALAQTCLHTLKLRLDAQDVAPDMICFGTQNGTDEWKPAERKEGKWLDKGEIRNNYLPTHMNIYPQDQHFLLNYIWNKCYRTTFIQDHGLRFDEGRRTWEDGLFVVNCLDKADNLLLIPDVLHRGCSVPAVDHLSGRFYDAQIPTYLQDETDFMNRFSGEFDFSSGHYCHANLQTLQGLLAAAYRVHGRKAKELMASAARWPIVRHWLDNVTPQNRFERYLRACVVHKQYQRVIDFYQLLSLKDAILKRIR